MAQKRWTGAALDVSDIWTITIANVWATSDTVTLTIGSSALTVTIGSDYAVGDVANALSAAVNSINSTDSLVTDESRNVGGRQIPELTNINATVAGAVVTLTHQVPGVPFVVVASESTAGTGTATEANSQVATGKHFFDNADNWHTGTNPVDGDEIVFNQGDVDCLYGLTETYDNTYKTDFTRTTDYTGRIGLPDLNPLGFTEYRQTHLKLYSATAVPKTMEFTKGQLGLGGGPTRIDAGAGDEWDAIRAIDTGRITGEQFNLDLENGLYLTGGITLGRGRFFLGTGVYFEGMTIGDHKATETNCHVVFAGAFNPSGPALPNVMRGGYLRHVNAPNNLTGTQFGSGLIDVTGGTIDLTGVGNYGAYTLATGAKLNHNTTGAITSVKIYSGGTLDLDGGGGPTTISTLEMYGNSKLVDTTGRRTATLTLVGCTLEDVTIIGDV